PSRFALPAPRASTQHRRNLIGERLDADLLTPSPKRRKEARRIRAQTARTKTTRRHRRRPLRCTTPLRTTGPRSCWLLLTTHQHPAPPRLRSTPRRSRSARTTNVDPL